MRKWWLNIKCTGRNTFGSFLSAGALTPSTISLISTTLGAGTVTLPFLASQNGIVLASILIIFGAGLSYFCGMLLVRCAIIVKAERYEDFARYWYGEIAEKLTSWWNILTLLGFVVSYIVFVKSLVPHILGIIFPYTIFESPSHSQQNKFETLSATFYSFWVLLPFGFARKVGTLRYNSIFGVCWTIYLSFCLIFMFFIDKSLVENPASNIKEVKLWSVNYNGLMTSIPFVVFAFLYQPNMPMIYKELQVQTYQQMKLVTFGGSLFSVALYILVSWFGYLIMVDTSLGVNILLLKSNNIAFHIATFGFFFIICAAAPMAFVPAKDSFEHYWAGGGNRLTYNENIVITICMLIFCYICAVAVPGISEVIIFLGWTTNPLSGFLLPILFYLKIHKDAPRWKKVCWYIWGVFLIVVSIWSFMVFITGS